METSEQNYRSPIIRDIPENDERLIDTGMLHFESSIAGYNERYHRGETSHTIHVWWARRPHSAMRSLVFSSLCKDKGEEALSVMARLAMTCDDASVEEARTLLHQEYKTPKVTLQRSPWKNLSWELSPIITEPDKKIKYVPIAQLDRAHAS